MSLSSDYTFIDKALHSLAFLHPVVQKVLCEIEDDLFGKKFKEIEPAPPVFVTGLPRAGTTLLLDLFFRTGEFVTYTYRHMPFILSPVLWSRISQPFQKAAKPKERAHGDGMMTSFDSPEAFEEIIWLTYLREKILRSDRLSPLTSGDISAEFVAKMRASIQKLVYLSNGGKESTTLPRYISKNNANISRLEVLTEFFPNSAIIVPFRHPLAHVTSLLKQHKRFTIEHSKDRFTKNYMKWLGHYEFGENFKPINFDGWLDNIETPEPTDVDFWLMYWTAAYRYVLGNSTDQVMLVDFDQLLANGESTLRRVADRVVLEDKSRFIRGKDILRAPTTVALESTIGSNDTWSAAQDLYLELKQQAI